MTTCKAVALKSSTARHDQVEAVPREREGLRSQFIVRTSALPTAALNEFASAPLRAAVAHRDVIEGCFSRIRSELDQALFELVNGIAGDPRRNSVLAFRRAIREGRPSRVCDRRSIAALLTDVKAGIATYDALYESRSQVAHEIGTLFLRERERSWIALQQAITVDDFQRGLLLSSRVLFNRLERFRSTDVTRFSAREERVARGLLRYLTRAARKATPFGTFCSVGAGRFVPLPTAEVDKTFSLHRPAWQFSRDPRINRTNVTLNRRLARGLWAFLQTDPASRLQLHVSPNPSIAIHGGDVTFLATVGQREVLQRATLKPGLRFVLTTLADAEAAGTSIALNDLLTTLEHATAAPKARAVGYVDELIQIGFLQLLPPFTDDDSAWEQTVVKLLATGASPTGQEIGNKLNRLIDLCTLFRSANVAERECVIDEMDRVIIDLERRVDREESLRIQPAIYEDATTDAVLEVSLTKGVESIRAAVESLVRLLQLIAPQRDEMAAMRAFFDRHFVTIGSPVPVLVFYEAYYRLHLRDWLERRKTEEHSNSSVRSDSFRFNPFELETVETRRATRSVLMDLVRARWDLEPDAIELHITSRELGELVKTSSSLDSSCSSASIFCQLVDWEQQPRLVLTDAKIYPGWGKYWSRFLHLLQERIDGYVNHIAGATSSEIVAELHCESFFNGNYHSPIVRHGIAYPGSSLGPEVASIALNRLAVSIDLQDPDGLVLTDASSGTRVRPADLGFLSGRLRPPLHRLLTLFGGGVISGFPLPARSERKNSADANSTAKSLDEAGLCDGKQSKARPAPSTFSVVYRPRIIFDDCIVLSRRRWTVSREKWPIRENGETAGQYWLRLWDWRVKHHIPERAFVRLNSSTQRDANEPRTVPLDNQVVSDTYVPSHDGLISEAEWMKEEMPESSMLAGMPGASVHSTATSRADWAKPQYIDFTAPLLVDLLSRLPNLPFDYEVIIEECYPDNSASGDTSDSRFGPDGNSSRENATRNGVPTELFATELVLQTDWSGR